MIPAIRTIPAILLKTAAPLLTGPAKREVLMHLYDEFARARFPGKARHQKWIELDNPQVAAQFASFLEAKLNQNSENMDQATEGLRYQLQDWFLGRQLDHLERIWDQAQDTADGNTYSTATCYQPANPRE